MKVATKLLVPLDFSEASMSALEYAIALRRSAATEITVAHVVDPIMFPVTTMPYSGALDVTALLAEQRRTAREHFADIAKRLARRRVKCRTVLLIGTPHAAIVDAAKKLKVDLVVMATHGRSGFSHLLLGSVAEKVVRSAPCAVLLVPPAVSGKRRKRAKR